MDRRTEIEARAAELVLRALEEGRLGGSAGVGGFGDELYGDPELQGDPELRAEVRRHTALLGLLPEALEERPPRPEVRGRVMAAIREVAEDRGEPDGRVRRPSAPVTSLAEARGRRPAAAAPSAGSALPPRWFQALAASLLLAVLALALVSGWLYGRVSEQQATIDLLSDRLNAAAEQRSALVAVRSDLEQARSRLTTRLALVSTPGVEVCPMRPTDPDAPFPDARGLLFLSGAGDAWYVRVANVEPTVEGRRYRLWFVLGNEVRPAGVLRPGDGGAVELSGTGLPDADRMTAALVTLEPADRSTARPTGPTVLFGDERMAML